jgi:excinuclease ABC subunit C
VPGIGARTATAIKDAVEEQQRAKASHGHTGAVNTATGELVEED